MKKPLNRFSDRVVAVALMAAGLVLHSLVHAPGWSLALFAIPFLLYMRFRVSPERFTSAAIIVFVLFLPAAFLVTDRLVPAEQKEFAYLVVFFVLLGLVDFFRRRRGAST